MWSDVRALNVLTSLLLVAAALLVSYGVLWRVVQLDTFSVRRIDLVGDAAHLSRAQVETVALRHLRGNFFTMNLESARDAFQKLPWVRRVEVRRRWPDRIEFAVEEHRALARWGSTALVNEYGEVFEGASNRPLPVFNGPPGSAQEVVQNYIDFGRALASIDRRIEEMRLSERRAWKLKLDDGTLVELGRDDIGRRLSAFVTAYGRIAQDMPRGTATVDLRYANGFAVRVKTNKANEGRA